MTLSTLLQAAERTRGEAIREWWRRLQEAIPPAAIVGKRIWFWLGGNRKDGTP